MSQATEVQAIQQFEGVTFFRNDLTPRFMEMSGQVFNIRPASFLMNRFIAVPSHLDEKTILAAELYCAAQFETSFRAKFLTLVTAVEQLAEPERSRTKGF